MGEIHVRLAHDDVIGGHVPSAVRIASCLTISRRGRIDTLIPTSIGLVSDPPAHGAATQRMRRSRSAGGENAVGGTVQPILQPRLKYWRSIG